MRQILFCWTAAASIAAAHDLPRSVAAQLEIRWPRPGETISVKLRVPLAAVPAAASFPQFGPGFLDFERTQPLLNDAVGKWVAETFQLTVNGARIEVQPRMVSTRLALESDTAPVRNDMNVYWSQVALEAILEFRPALSTGQAEPRLAVDWRLSRDDLQVQTAIEFTGSSGETPHRFRYDGNIGPLALNPSGVDIGTRFAVAGLRMFARDPDLLCLLTALLLPVGKRLRRASSPILIPFALAVPLSFVWSNANGQPIWWPSWTRFAVACLVFYAACESAAYPRGWRWRWILAFCGGLVAGLALSLQFRETLQFAAGSDRIASTACVIGAVAAVAAAGFAAAVAFRWSARWRFVRITASVVIAHQAWHSMLDHGAALAKYELWPARWDAALWASCTKTAFAIAAAGAVAWTYGLVSRRSRTAARA